MKKAVIFDLDGVIVSTDECHYLAWKRMAEEENIYFDRQINNRLRGVSRMQSLEIVLEKATLTYSERQKQQMAARKNDYYVQCIKQLTPANILPGVMRNLDQLKQNGILVAIGSSSKNAPLILQQIGLARYFHAVSDGNCIQHSKPHPQVFLVAADMLGVDPHNCLVVEDADSGIEAGKSAGMHTLAVNGARGGQFTAESLDKISLLLLVNQL